MANVKISELPVANTATQSQIIPIVDGVETRQISVDNVLNIASGVKAGIGTINGSYLQCQDADNVIGVSGHYIPAINATYDLGSSTNKIRHLYLSDSSVFIGDNKLSTANDELIFTNVDGVTEYKTCLMPTSIPQFPSSTGKVGQIAVDSTHIYVCVSENSWSRILIDSIYDTAWTDPTP